MALKSRWEDGRCTAEPVTPSPALAPLWSGLENRDLTARGGGWPVDGGQDTLWTEVGACLYPQQPGPRMADGGCPAPRRGG